MGSHDMETLFSFLTVVLILLIPTVSLLCRHQVRMAALLRQNPNPAPLPNPNQEVSELRSMIAQQAMAIDSLANAQRELAGELRASRALNERINS